MEPFSVSNFNSGPPLPVRAVMLRRSTRYRNLPSTFWPEPADRPGHDVEIGVDAAVQRVEAQVRIQRRLEVNIHIPFSEWNSQAFAGFRVKPPSPDR